MVTSAQIHQAEAQLQSMQQQQLQIQQQRQAIEQFAGRQPTQMELRTATMQSIPARQAYAQEQAKAKGYIPEYQQAEKELQQAAKEQEHYIKELQEWKYAQKLANQDYAREQAEAKGLEWKGSKASGAEITSKSGQGVYSKYLQLQPEKIDYEQPIQVPPRFNPVYVNDQLTGYYDIQKGVSIPLANINIYLAQEGVTIKPASAEYFKTIEKLRPEFPTLHFLRQPTITELKLTPEQTSAMAQIKEWDIKKGQPTFIGYEIQQPKSPQTMIQKFISQAQAKVQKTIVAPFESGKIQVSWMGKPITPEINLNPVYQFVSKGYKKIKESYEQLEEANLIGVGIPGTPAMIKFKDVLSGEAIKKGAEYGRKGGEQIGKWTVPAKGVPAKGWPAKNQPMIPKEEKVKEIGKLGYGLVAAGEISAGTFLGGIWGGTAVASPFFKPSVEKLGESKNPIVAGLSTWIPTSPLEIGEYYVGSRILKASGKIGLGLFTGYQTYKTVTAETPKEQWAAGIGAGVGFLGLASDFIKVGKVEVQTKKPAGGLSGMEVDIGRAATEKGGVVAGTTSLKGGLPKGEFETGRVSDVDIYVYEKEKFNDVLNSVSNAINKNYESAGKNWNNVELDIYKRGASKQAAFVDKTTGKSVAEIIMRGGEVAQKDKIIEINGIKFRDYTQVLNDKAQIIRAYEKGNEGISLTKYEKAKSDFALANQIMQNIEKTKTVYSGLFLTPSGGGEGKVIPLFGIGEGGYPIIGSPSLKQMPSLKEAIGFTGSFKGPETPLSTMILTSKEALPELVTEKDIPIVDMVKKIDKTGKNIKKLNEGDLPKVFKSEAAGELANEKVSKAIYSILKKESKSINSVIIKNYGSAWEIGQRPNIEEPIKFRREPHDIEIQVKSKEGGKELGIKIVNEANKIAGANKYFVDNPGGKLGVFTKTDKGVTDKWIELKTPEEAAAEEGLEVFRYGYKIDRKPITLGGTKKVQAWSEQLIRKAGASGQWKYNEALKKFEVNPDAWRAKDVLDVYAQVKSAVYYKKMPKSMDTIAEEWRATWSAKDPRIKERFEAFDKEGLQVDVTDTIKKSTKSTPEISSFAINVIKPSSFFATMKRKEEIISKYKSSKASFSDNLKISPSFSLSKSLSLSSISPSPSPSLSPSLSPSISSSISPSISPSLSPSPSPSKSPSISPSPSPSLSPSLSPSPSRYPNPRPSSLISPSYSSKQFFKQPSKSYLVLSKKRGKPFLITPKPLTKGEALAIGVKFTKRTERATFKLIPSREKPIKMGIAPLTETQVFRLGYRLPIRKGKVLPVTGTFIQRARTRMGTREERRAIQSYRTKSKGWWK
jgi:hypothetical protein